MPALITPSLRSSLERIKHAGSINGLLLGWKRQILLNLLPFEEYRSERLLQTTQDARNHFGSGGDRAVQTFWFGYDICHVLVCFKGDCTLVILHARAEEGDFIRSIAETFLEDSQLLIDALLNPSPEAGAETQPLTPDGEMPSFSDSHTNFISRVA